MIIRSVAVLLKAFSFFILLFLLPVQVIAQQAIQTNLNFSIIEPEGVNTIGYGPELEVAWQNHYIKLDDNLGVLIQVGFFLQPRVFSESRSFALNTPPSISPPRYNNSRRGISLAVGLYYNWKNFDFEVSSGFTQHYSHFKEIDRHGVSPENPDEFSDWNTTFDLHFISILNLNRYFGLRGGIRTQHLLTGDDFASTRVSPTLGMVFRY